MFKLNKLRGLTRKNNDAENVPDMRNWTVYMPSWDTKWTGHYDNDFQRLTEGGKETNNIKSYKCMIGQPNMSCLKHQFRGALLETVIIPQ